MWNEYHRQSDLSLDIELTTYCNARCPQCSRTDQNDVNKRKHWLPLKQVTYNQFKKWFPKVSGIRNFHFSGKFGDPGMCKDLYEIVKYILDSDETTTVSVNTNGSMRDEDFWFDFASLGKYNLVKVLMDYVIKRNFPEITTNQNKYLSFLKFVIDAQAKLISKWMSVGFIHGVMNTDNCSIVGDTIDYGPCAFMDKYNENTVFSSIDTFGRYSYKNQPLICQWNLAQLANCILPFLSDEKEKSIKIAQNEIDKYSEVYHNYFSKEIFKKLGFSCKIENDNKLKDELFDIMKRDGLDFTISFSNLYFELLNINNDLSEFTKKSRDFTKWISKWKLRLKKEKKSVNQIAENLKQSNPIIIPRNHLVEEAINFALENDNFSKYFNLLKLVSDPFRYKAKYVNYYKPPDVLDENFKTFCGT